MPVFAGSMRYARHYGVVVANHALLFNGCAIFTVAACTTAKTGFFHQRFDFRHRVMQSKQGVTTSAFGFAPADYTRQLEINNRQKGIDKSVNQEETKLKRQYYLATRMGDSEGRKEARDKLLELGAKHPALEINAGTVGDVLDRSIEAQKRVTERMRNGVAYSPKMLKEIEQNLREYD